MRVYDRATLKAVKNDIKGEKELLQALNDPWFPRLCGSFVDAQRYYLVSEWQEGGLSLASHIRDRKLTKNEAQFYFGSILVGLEKLHNLDIIHRDLTLESVSV
jgi:serine/threonine protein kinase